MNQSRVPPHLKLTQRNDQNVQRRERSLAPRSRALSAKKSSQRGLTHTETSTSVDSVPALTYRCTYRCVSGLASPALSYDPRRQGDRRVDFVGYVSARGFGNPNSR